ncbi:YCF48-related protein [Glaciimonas sp. PCH181]|uniref:WD40/YVTN/BNR-like repeat-containing protein n=1 Tax=Glaciimonas sp. PCH181 TaxID=2133943 RepID=UPI000D353F97|nr:YCF48-related protein [Glaciimonas sp. PCH181]PUA19180.1 hypothetical protein C7W93_04625 [Glaciimonas sp. PCH181]
MRWLAKVSDKTYSRNNEKPGTPAHLQHDGAHQMFARYSIFVLFVATTLFNVHFVMAQSKGLLSPLDRPALMVRLPAKSYLLSVAEAGYRLVAVGERGVIVLSDDDGMTWRQAKVPVSVTLTAVQFLTARLGWAVGHYGIVLHTEDGGETWVRQFEGVTAARIVLEAAKIKSKEAGSDGPTNKKALSDAELLVKDGADKPFLDLHFDSAKSGVIVGAYNLILHTEDGGKTWLPWLDRLDNPQNFHLYAIAASGSQLYIAGEKGVLFRSDDCGKSFTRLDTPYKGSYFALSLFPSGEVVVAGLRGNAFRSADQGASWKKIAVAAPISFTAAKLTRKGSLILANQAGQLFMSNDLGVSLKPIHTSPLPPINDLLITQDGALVVVGANGVTRLTIPGDTTSTGVKK